MWTPKEEIITHSKKLNILYKTLSEADGQKLKNEVISRHQLSSSHPNSRFLFEKLNDCSSTNREDSISLLKTYPYQEEVFVFFEETKDKTVFSFRHLKDFLSVYRDCAIFTVYITGVNFDFLISYTSELTLVCNAIAADWLDSLLGQL
ncbi:hypothetical protein [Gynuella sunshinyii]|uniref:hypothetical protein n=1 Tax=Gynuella sunshinyii TaxID=1445505 RepID=UPI0005CC813F|nr:hypothetical protein [Gynuella sunshinyii]